MRSRHVTVTASRLAGGLGLLAGAWLVGGCGTDPPRTPHALHPIPEARARDLIARTFRDAGTPPEADRFVMIRERRVRLEVAGAGRKFGVAYLTADDWANAADALPSRPTSGSLVVAVGDGGMRILCLFAADYAADDDTGDDHRSTTIAADRRLERDVRDFLHRAEAQKWP